MNPDPLDWIRQQLATDPAILARVEPILNAARMTYAGDVYIARRPLEQRQVPSRRTLARRARAH